MSRCTVAAAFLIALVLPSSASAARAEIVFDETPRSNFYGVPTPGYPGYVLRYVESPGEVADLRVWESSGALHAEDAGHAIEAETGCTAEGSGVVCTGASWSRAIIDLGDGNDSIRVSGADAMVRLGDGDDTITANDTFPSVTVEGGLGTDSMDARVISYRDHPGAVSVSLDGVANDGLPGENENVATPNVYGTPYDDRIDMTAAAKAAYVEGGAGNDTILGGPDEDFLLGDAGDDTISGAGAHDKVAGGAGTNVLDGGPGGDGFFAGNGGAAGHDDVIGGPGPDYATYSAPAGTTITATLDDRPGDGLPGENDNIRSDVEGLAGSGENDHFVGSEDGNTLSGGGGSDVLEGRGGNDVLDATGTGGTTAIGGPGADLVRDAGLDDAVLTRDGGYDEVRCPDRGIGYLDSDATDVTTWCIPKSGLPGAGTRIAIDRKGRGRVTVSCIFIHRAVPCTGQLSLVLWHTVRGKPRADVLARQSYSLPLAWEPGSFTFKLNSRWRAALARKRKLDVGVRVEQTLGAPVELRTEAYKWRLLAPPKKPRRR